MKRQHQRYIVNTAASTKRL